MRKSKRLTINEEAILYFDGYTVGELIYELRKIQDKFGPKAYVSSAYQDHYRNCGCDPSSKMTIVHSRPETNEEYNTRIANERAIEAALKLAGKKIQSEAEQAERAEYERLRAKYNPS